MPGRPTNLDDSRARAYCAGAGGCCLDVFTLVYHFFSLSLSRGWSGSPMALDKPSVPGRPAIWIIVGQGPPALAVRTGRVGLDSFTLIYPFTPLPPSLWVGWLF